MKVFIDPETANLPALVWKSSDGGDREGRHGRYAYGNQPKNSRKGCKLVKDIKSQ